MIGLLKFCGVLAIVLGGFCILLYPIWTGVALAIVGLFVCVFFWALAAIIEELRLANRALGAVPAATKPQSFSIGGVQYVADPPAGKTPPAPVDDATIWPDVDDPAIRLEIIHAAKLTEQKHVTVRGRMYSVDFKK